MGIKSRFCPRCGAKTNISDGLCAVCKVEKNEPKLPEKVTVRVCKDCGAVDWRGVWVKTDEAPETYLARYIEHEARLPPGSVITKIDIKKLGRKGQADFAFELDGKKFEQELLIDLYVRDSRCQDCGDMISQSHKAILQIRCKKDAKKILDFVNNNYRNEVIKIDDQREGFDVFMLSKDSARHLAGDLRKRFKFSSVNVSHRQYSWDKSKDRPKTRINVSMRQDD